MVWKGWCGPIYRVTTCLENLEMSKNLIAVREMLGILLKVREVSVKISCQRKVGPKTVYCKLHICVIRVFRNSLLCVKY